MMYLVNEKIVKKGQASTSFLKKRSKKLLSIGMVGASRGAAMGKVFLLLFFQKKKCLPSLAIAPA